MKHIILGNGPAGVVAAEALRRAAPQDEILLVGNEDAPPYSRMAIPYLLEGNIDEAGTYLRKSPGHFDRLRIHQLRGMAVSVNTEKRTVLFDDGHFERYDRLLIATGSHPVRPPIPGIDLAEVQTCWTLADSRAIAALATPGSRVLQLGAGFIGCIIMESLVKRGVQLTVVEMGDRMVPRMMTPEAGGMIRRWVEKQGVRVVTKAGVERIAKGAKGAKDGGAPLSVTLTSGEKVACDLVIVAAGVAPNVSFLEGTEVHIAKGVLVDDSMQTSVPGIYAAGDVAEAPDLFSGRHLVAAIQPNAADQARVAALNMAGQTAKMKGVLAINVLDSLGMVSSSFGEWQGVAGGEGGAGVEKIDEANGRYISLQFRDDVLIGATSIGLTEHIGALRGLIQGKTRLGAWKQKLLETPTRFAEAHIACQRPNS